MTALTAQPPLECPCGYPLAGLPEAGRLAVCPECGIKIDLARPPRLRCGSACIPILWPWLIGLLVGALFGPLTYHWSPSAAFIVANTFAALNIANYLTHRLLRHRLALHSVLLWLLILNAALAAVALRDGAAQRFLFPRVIHVRYDTFQPIPRHWPPPYHTNR